jgi:hypothetical protein
MIQSLASGEIDIGIGLTEGWISGLANGKQNSSTLPYRIIGSYVASPLCWAISAGAHSKVTSVDQLRGSKIGVSRIGSGSYVMPFVLADRKGWLEFGRPSSGASEPNQGEELDKDQLQGGQLGKKQVGKDEYFTPAAHAPKGEHVADTGADDAGESSSKPPFEFIPLQTFEKLRKGVNDGTIDAFMWEHFTSKKYYDNGEIRRIGEIYTPWASWKIVARDPKEKNISKMLDSINKGISHFREEQEEAVKYIHTNLDYSEADAQSWLKTVDFSPDVKDPVVGDLKKAYDILMKAGVIDGSLPLEETHVKIT